MNLRAVLLLVVMLSLLFAMDLQAAEKNDTPGIVVWRLQANKGVDEVDVNLISNYVTNQVARYSGSKVISEADIHTILKGQEARQRCGVEDTSCIAEVGAALGVPEAVSGDIGLIGSYWMLNLRRIRVRSSEVIGRSSRSISGSVDQLIEELSGAVAELFELKEGEAPKIVLPMEKGDLIVDSEPMGASLFLDGKEKGRTPFHGRIDEGKYKLELKLDEYETIKRTVSIDSEKSAELFIVLEHYYPMNPYKKWGHVAFWTGLGVGVLFVGLGHGMAAKTADEINDGDIDSYDANRAWSNLALSGYVIGSALVITGVVLWILSPDDEHWAKRNTSIGVMSDGQGAYISLDGRW